MQFGFNDVSRIAGKHNYFIAFKILEFFSCLGLSDRVGGSSNPCLVSNVVLPNESEGAERNCAVRCHIAAGGNARDKLEVAAEKGGS